MLEISFSTGLVYFLKTSALQAACKTAKDSKKRIQELNEMTRPTSNMDGHMQRRWETLIPLIDKPIF